MPNNWWDEAPPVWAVLLKIMAIIGFAVVAMIARI